MTATKVVRVDGPFDSCPKGCDCGTKSATYHFEDGTYTVDFADMYAVGDEVETNADADTVAGDWVEFVD